MRNKSVSSTVLYDVAGQLDLVLLVRALSPFVFPFWNSSFLSHPCTRTRTERMLTRPNEKARSFVYSHWNLPSKSPFVYSCSFAPFFLLSSFPASHRTLLHVTTNFRLLPGCTESLISETCCQSFVSKRAVREFLFRLSFRWKNLEVRR